MHPQTVRQIANKKILAEMGADRISYLPEDVMNKILSHLSLRDAVRTSILSSNWRRKWAHLKDLNFDDKIMVVAFKDPKLALNKLIKIVDDVLLLHSGLIHKFELSHHKLRGCHDIVKWISFLSSKSVKEFVLNVSEGERFKLPPSLYSWKGLIHLELCNCVVKPPSAFNSFPSLKILDLQEVTMDQVDFEHLISGCALLEELNLSYFDGFSQLNINSPNLLSIDIYGVFKDFHFENAVNVSDVCICLEEIIGSGQDRIMEDTCGLIKFFASLPRVQRLQVLSFSLKFLAIGKVPDRLPTLCMNLDYLSLDINFHDDTECLAVLCILRSSPNLRVLKMQARPMKEDVVGELTNDVEEDKSFLLNRLQLVEMMGMPMLPLALNIYSFLLGNSPLLERMTVKPASILCKDLLQFRQASAQAEIIYLDPY